MLNDEVDRPATGSEGETPNLQEIMREIMAKIDTKNRELNGHLCLALGKESRRSLFFDTPLKVPTEGQRGSADYYLVATHGGFKLLQVEPEAKTSKWGEGWTVSEVIGKLIKHTRSVQRNLKPWLEASDVFGWNTEPG